MLSGPAAAVALVALYGGNTAVGAVGADALWLAALDAAAAAAGGVTFDDAAMLNCSRCAYTAAIASLFLAKDASASECVIAFAWVTAAAAVGGMRKEDGADARAELSTDARRSLAVRVPPPMLPL